MRGWLDAVWSVREAKRFWSLGLKEKLPGRPVTPPHKPSPNSGLLTPGWTLNAWELVKLLILCHAPPPSGLVFSRAAVSESGGGGGRGSLKLPWWPGYKPPR